MGQFRVAESSASFLLCLFTTLEEDVEEILKVYGLRWNVGVSRQGHIVQPVKDRPRPTDSGLVAWEAPWRENKTVEPSGNMVGKEYAQRTRLQCKVNADVASLHEIPVAETVDNVRKQQGLPKRVRCGSSHRRGIGGDMVGRMMWKLEKPSMPGGEIPSRRCRL